MATGLSESGGVMAPTDVVGAGDASWATVAGLPATDPMVGGPYVEGLGPFDVERGRSRIVTTPEGQQGPATGGLMATPDGIGHTLDSWRDLFNWRGSPMPWLLIAALLVLGFMQLRVEARAGRGAMG
jgi:hypothetical protein